MQRSIWHRIWVRQAGTGLASGRQEEDEEKEEEGGWDVLYPQKQRG